MEPKDVFEKLNSKTKLNILKLIKKYIETGKLSLPLRNFLDMAPVEYDFLLIKLRRDFQDQNDVSISEINSAIIDFFEG